MKKTLRAGIIGFAHMHVNEVVLYLYDHPDYILAGGADLTPDTPENKPARYTREWNKNFNSETYGLPIYPDVDTLLDKAELDIAFILCENSKKVEIVEKVARRGITCIIEKPMCLTADEARRIIEIQKETGVDMFVNWPIAWRGYLYAVKNAVDSGIVGRPIKIEAHAGHTGPLGVGAKHRGVTEEAEPLTDGDRAATWWYQDKCGGGVYLDMLCYGAMYCLFYAGDDVKRVTASAYNLNTKYGDIADNVTALYEYDDLLAITDTTWTTPASLLPPGPTVFCEGGAVRPERDENGNVYVAVYDLSGERLEAPEFVFPSYMKDMPSQYAAHKTEGAPMPFISKLENNLRVMEMIDAARLSVKEGKKIEIYEK